MPNDGWSVHLWPRRAATPSHGGVRLDGIWHSNRHAARVHGAQLQLDHAPHPAAIGPCTRGRTDLSVRANRFATPIHRDASGSTFVTLDPSNPRLREPRAHRAFVRLRRSAADRLVRATRKGRGGPLPAFARRVLGRPANSFPAYWYTQHQNFGDLVSPVLLAHFFDIEPLAVRRDFAGKLLGAGSILGAARRGDTVWGSGLNREARVDGRGIEFLAVRGPRTRALIDGDVPETYGDPGILLPLIYEPRRSTHRFPVGLVPHYVDQDLMTSDDPSVPVIDVTQADWCRVIDRIASCDTIVSSSLHGIIAAEAYGVPAVWVQPSDRIGGGVFKFLDYYEGTNRDARPGDCAMGFPSVSSMARTPPVLDTAPLLATASHTAQRYRGRSSDGSSNPDWQ